MIGRAAGRPQGHSAQCQGRERFRRQPHFRQPRVLRQPVAGEFPARVHNLPHSGHGARREVRQRPPPLSAGGSALSDARVRCPGTGRQRRSISVTSWLSTRSTHDLAPVSSAGPERLFSAAGKMHDGQKKNTKEDTLSLQLEVKMNRKHTDLAI